MLEKTEARHAHQQFLVDLENRYFENELSAAELTTLCLMPELVRLNTGFQRLPLLKNIPAEQNQGTATPSPMIEFLRNYSWKGHTDRIRRSLFNWHLGKYPLVLWNHIPTPLELLKIQADGKRVITVFNQAEEWEQLHLGKTAWEFIIHDLIHADHFFENSEWQLGQIDFYKFILSKWEQPMMIRVRSYCAEQFDYLISDMNSHPQHMYQTLTALCLMAWKKSLGISNKARLPETEETQFQDQMNYFLASRLLK